jgi:hypothetical protein
MQHNAIIVYPPLTETAPEAIGRLYFFGWWRSASASRMSLKQYIELVIKQNEIKTNKVGIK